MLISTAFLVLFDDFLPGFFVKLRLRALETFLSFNFSLFSSEEILQGKVLVFYLITPI